MSSDENIEVINLTTQIVLNIGRMLTEDQAIKMIKMLKQAINSSADILARYGCIRAICSLILSSRHIIGKWVPSTLYFISQLIKNEDMISQAVRKCLTKFTDHHRKSLEYDLLGFDEKEKAALMEYMNPYNYFA